MKISIFTVITKSLIILLGLIAVYMFFLIVFGNSPSVADVLVVIVSAIVIYLMQSGFQQGRFEGKMVASLRHFQEDITEIKENIKKMEQRLR